MNDIKNNSELKRNILLQLDEIINDEKFVGYISSNTSRARVTLLKNVKSYLESFESNLDLIFLNAIEEVVHKIYDLRNLFYSNRTLDKDEKLLLSKQLATLSDIFNNSNKGNNNQQEEVYDSNKIILEYKKYQELLLELQNKAQDDMKKFEGVIEDRKKFLDKTQNALELSAQSTSQLINERYTEIDNSIDNYKTNIDHDVLEFKEKVNEELKNLQGNVYSEALATFFLRERRKLKGDINIIVLILFILIILIVALFSELRILNILQTETSMGKVLLIVVAFIECLLGVHIFYNICRSIGKKKKIDFEFITINLFKDLIAIFTPYWCWLFATFLGMGTLFCFAYKVYYLFSVNKPNDINGAISNMPVFAILIWFTWFCSKQFSYTKQICDEYEYKYALSKSYLKYRDEAEALAGHDKAILISLLDSVIKNIATSPVKSVQSDCHTPFAEVFNSVKGIVKKD